MCVCVRVCTSTLSVDNFHTFEPNSQSVCVCISTLSVNNLHTFEPNYWGAGGRVGGGGNGRSVLAGGDSQGKDALQ